MSGHADTCPVCGSRATARVTDGETFQYEALGDDALVAENQQLRDALEQIDAAGGVEVRYGGQIAGAMKDIARAALAGTPSEATG
jgi:hypothetical protein